MTPKEHAAIWNQAAAIVAGMDARVGWMSQAIGPAGSGQSRSFSEKEAAAWDAYANAARVLRQIASGYSAAAEDK